MLPFLIVYSVLLTGALVWALHSAWTQATQREAADTRALDARLALDEAERKNADLHKLLAKLADAMSLTSVEELAAWHEALQRRREQLGLPQRDVWDELDEDEKRELRRWAKRA